jgi:hypothetical protein
MQPKGLIAVDIPFTRRDETSRDSLSLYKPISAVCSHGFSQTHVGLIKARKFIVALLLLDSVERLQRNGKLRQLRDNFPQ